MMRLINKTSVSIPLAPQASGSLTIQEEKKNTLFEVEEGSADVNESPRYHLQEGCNYEYTLPEGYTLEQSIIVRPLRLLPHCGRLCTNIYVGTLPLAVYHNGKLIKTITVEVRSSKMSYEEDYQKMLEDITHTCTELLMQQSAPVNQQFELDASCDPQTLYQRFAFIHSLIGSEEFADAIHRIHTSPVTKWKEAEVSRDISNVRRINHRIARQLQTRTQRIPLPENHPLKNRFDSLPGKVTVPYKEETVDIPENRFVKYVLENLLQFCTSLMLHTCASKRLVCEARQTCEQLEQYLSLSLFKEIGNLSVLPLNSPVLQRKEGYREVLQAWFMFDMAAKLVWKGGDEVYEAGKKDIATLYEYWLFFKLVKVIEEVFGLSPISLDHLIVSTKEGLELTLKQGKTEVIKGISRDEKKQRDLHVEFHYNKTFGSTGKHTAPGSWTVRMRPDYTLTIWPEGMTQKQAEKKELLVHIHFDAKYKVDLYQKLFEEEADPTNEEAIQQEQKQEKVHEREGYYKRADLLKMHAYKDAIHRTAGAYILYPGTAEKAFTPYHEILPGLGAFAIAPSQDNDGSQTLKTFLEEVIKHTRDRATKREKITYHKYNILTPPREVKEPAITPSRPHDPNQPNVLVAYYRNEKHKTWITTTHLYNIRTGKSRGALPLNEQTAGVKYILLHGPGETKNATLLYRVSEEGPEVYSREELLDKGYPSDPTTSFYIVYELLEGLEEELKGKEWDIRIPGYYKSGRQSSEPFVVPLEELLEKQKFLVED